MLLQWVSHGAFLKAASYFAICTYGSTHCDWRGASLLQLLGAVVLSFLHPMHYQALSFQKACLTLFLESAGLGHLLLCCDLSATLFTGEKLGSESGEWET